MVQNSINTNTNIEVDNASIEVEEGNPFDQLKDKQLSNAPNPQTQSNTNPTLKIIKHKYSFTPYKRIQQTIKLTTSQYTTKTNNQIDYIVIPINILSKDMQDIIAQLSNNNFESIPLKLQILKQPKKNKLKKINNEYEKECKLCKSTFITPHHANKYCQACKQQIHAAKQIKSLDSMISIECQNCHSTFQDTIKRRFRKYCNTCKQNMREIKAKRILLNLQHKAELQKIKEQQAQERKDMLERERLRILNKIQQQNE